MVYLICSLPMTGAQPEQVAARGQGHWRAENWLHRVPDVVSGEDRHPLRTANGPEIMAALRNLAISLIRLFHGPGASIATTTRSLARRPKRAIRPTTQPPQPTLPTPWVAGWGSLGRRGKVGVSCAPRTTRPSPTATFPRHQAEKPTPITRPGEKGSLVVQTRSDEAGMTRIWLRLRRLTRAVGVRIPARRSP